jgi:hypothetical protein
MFHFQSLTLNGVERRNLSLSLRRLDFSDKAGYLKMTFAVSDYNMVPMVLDYR